MEYSKEYLAMQQKLDGAKPKQRVLVAGNSTIARAVRSRGGSVSLPQPSPQATAPTEPIVIGGKKVKHVFIEATFPELKGGKMYQHAHGEAGGTKPAIARAFRELLKTIPGKRVSVITARISITTKTVEDDNV